MTADNFEIEDPNCNYFQSINSLVVYGYYELKKSSERYSRMEIAKRFQGKNRGSKDTSVGLEDYLRNRLISGYLRKNKNKFGLHGFQVNPGLDEEDEGLPMGRVDIAFTTTSPTSQLGSPGYIFECKRLNKYAHYVNGYVDDGMKRFVEKQYYASPSVTTAVAGMIAFVEVDLIENKHGRLEIEKVIDLVKQKVNKEKISLEVKQNLIPYNLDCSVDANLSSFQHFYESKHIRRKHGPVEISIYHLFLDYYDLIIN